MSILPTVKTEIKSQDPKNLILFGLPKVGKTTALAELPNCLIVDLENGSQYVSGFTVKASTYIDLYKIAKALKEEDHNFKFVVLDTVTALEEIALDLQGKISNILSAKSDAIAYLYRDSENGNLMANFGDMNSVLTGARMPHLAGKTILLAERIQDDDQNWKIKTYWENIYPSLKHE